ncbi:MAG: hypothetical protein Q9183_007030, partial [Haloplaca sp. 2 TL-2023]
SSCPSTPRTHHKTSTTSPQKRHHPRAQTRRHPILDRHPQRQRQKHDHDARHRFRRLLAPRAQRPIAQGPTRSEIITRRNLPHILWLRDRSPPSGHRPLDHHLHRRPPHQRFHRRSHDRRRVQERSRRDARAGVPSFKFL